MSHILVRDVDLNPRYPTDQNGAMTATATSSIFDAESSVMVLGYTIERAATVSGEITIGNHDGGSPGIRVFIGSDHPVGEFHDLPHTTLAGIRGSSDGTMAGATVAVHYKILKA